MFVSPDPSDPLDEGVGMNRYIYGLGSPTWHRDPWGLSSKEGGKTGGGGEKACANGYEANDAGDCVVSTHFDGGTVDVVGDGPKADMPDVGPATGILRRALEAGREALKKVQRELTRRKDCQPVSLADAKSAADTAAVILGMVNSSPTTAAGLVVGTLAVEASNHFGPGNTTMTSGNGVIVVQDFPYFRAGIGGWTMGNVVFLGPGAGADTMAHERAHVVQGYDLGQFYTGAHILAQGASAALSNDYGDSNPLESGPNQPNPSAYSGSLPVCQP